MAYEHLKSILTKLGVPDADIQRTYILQFGSICLGGIGDFESERFPISRRQSVNAPTKDAVKSNPNYVDQIIQALQKHPNIFALRPPARKRHELVLPTAIGDLVIGNTFSFRVHLPERLQKHKDWYEGRQRPSGEDFNVLSSGTLFVAFAELDDYPAWPNIGHEYRDLVTQQIQRESKLKCPSLGPSPIHPDFYIVQLATHPQTGPSTPKVFSYEGDMIILVEVGQSIDSVIQEIFEDLNMLLVGFYAVMSHRSLLIDYTIEIFNQFEDLAKNIQDLAAISWWRLDKSIELSRATKRVLSSLHVRMVEYGASVLHFRRERARALNEMKEHFILNKIHGYLSDNSEMEGDIPESLASATVHFAGELQALGTIRSLVFATLLGAAVGALLTALLPKLF